MFMYVCMCMCVCIYLCRFFFYYSKCKNKRIRQQQIFQVYDNIISSQNKTLSTSNFQSNLKKNLKRSKFISVDEFENEIKVDAYIRTKNAYPINVTNGNKVNCTVCLHNDDNHQMKAKYM